MVAAGGSCRPLNVVVRQTATMPNGHYGTEEEWKRLEAPLREIDAALELFARRHNTALSRNYHNWPERSLRWGADPERLIQIYLENEQRLTWNLWLCASQDRDGQRFWRQQSLRHNVHMGRDATCDRPSARRSVSHRQWVAF